MSEREGSAILLRSSFRNQPIGHRLFAVLMCGVSLLFFALSVYGAFAATPAVPMELLPKAFLLLLSLVMGFVLLGAGVIPFMLTQTVVLDAQRLAYDEFWESTSIPLANVLAAFRLVKNRVSFVFVYSRAATLIAVGYEFSEDDKARLWAALQRALGPLGAFVQDGLSVGELYEKEAEIHEAAQDRKALREGEIRMRLHTRILSTLTVGSLLALYFGVVVWVILLFAERGRWLFELLAFILLVAGCLLAATMVTRDERLPALCIVAVGLAAAIPGSYMIVAGLGGFDAEVQRSGGWTFGVVLLLIGLFVCFLSLPFWMSRSTDRRSQEHP